MSPTWTIARWGTPPGPPPPRPAVSRPMALVMRHSSRLAKTCCTIATPHRASMPYLLCGDHVTSAVGVCAGIAAAPPRTHDPRHQRMALFRPRQLPRPGPRAAGGDRLAAARAGGPPPAGAAAAVGPLPPRLGRHPPSAASRAADPRDRPDHRCAAPTSRSGGNQLQVGVAVLG